MANKTYINSVTVQGFVGADAEPKNLDGGKTVLNFSVATSRFRGEGETREQFTEWHRIAAWGKLASTIGNVAKGAHVKVEGELRSREYSNDSRQGPDVRNRRQQDRGPRQGSPGGRSLRGRAYARPLFCAPLRNKHQLRRA